jgi:hypothetical protein
MLQIFANMARLIGVLAAIASFGFDLGHGRFRGMPVQ